MAAGRQTATVPGWRAHAGLGAQLHGADGTHTIFLVALNKMNLTPTSLLRMGGVPNTEFHAAPASARAENSATADCWFNVSSGWPARFVSAYLVQLASDQLGRPSWAPPAHRPARGRASEDLPAGFGQAAGGGHIRSPPHRRRGTHRRRYRAGSPTPSPAYGPVSFTDESWPSVVGQHVDERLAAADVQLTVGGEPTFVVR